MRCLTLLLLLLASPLAHADARAQLDAFSGGVKGLSADFRQRVYDPDGRLGEESTGTVQLRAPRQFRWEYLKPFPQLIVADGDHVWVYDPDLEQVSVRNQSYEEQGSPLAVLIDPAELDRQFKVREAGRSQGLEWLELVPHKPDAAPFERARLGFGAAGLATMELFDGLGQRTEVSFSGWQRDPAFTADRFRFTPPPGVDVVGEVAESAEVIPLQD